MLIYLNFFNLAVLHNTNYTSLQKQLFHLRTERLVKPTYEVTRKQNNANGRSTRVQKPPTGI